MIQNTGTYADTIQRERQRRRRQRIGPLRMLTGRVRRLPDFIIVGAQKCGTTALHEYLLEHPDVLPALTKEVHFFDLNFDRGTNWYRAHFPASRRAGTVTGEASPSYFPHPRAPERIAATAPDAKLIVLFRNPVDRAYSHYQHNVRKGREKHGFGQVIQLEKARIESRVDQVLDDESYFRDYYQFSYLLRGLYLAQLRRWHARVPRENLLVLDSRELITDPAPTYGRVREFLGLSAVDPEFKIHHHYGYDEIDPALREELVEFFREPNESLYEYLGRDLGWE